MLWGESKSKGTGEARKGVEEGGRVVHALMGLTLTPALAQAHRSTSSSSYSPRVTLGDSTASPHGVLHMLGFSGVDVGSLIVLESSRGA